nr:hypothetical protein [Tanacetum cinerariifolium]
FMDSIHSSEQSSVSQNYVSCDVVDQCPFLSGSALTKEVVAYEQKSDEAQAIKKGRYNKTPAKKAAKKRKLNKEVEDLKRHLEIVPDEDDDVYAPLARKVPVVDYEIIELNNKPYYKIIRADGTHQLYISFLTLLKNFNREDLEAL